MPPITELHALRVAALATASLVGAHGPILGTTPRGLDIGGPHGSDVHFEMSSATQVAIAEPDSPRALRTGVEVGVFPHGFAILAVHLDGLEVCRIAARSKHGTRESLELRCSNAKAARDVVLAPGAQVVRLRAGSRNSLVAAHDAYVIADPASDGTNDSARSVIVADGPLQLPL